MSKYLDENGLLYLWGKIKAWVTNQGYITSGDIPEGAAAGTYNSNFHDWYLHCKTGRKVTGVIDGAVYYSAGNVPSTTYEYAIFLFALGGRDNAAAQLFIKQKLKAAVIKKNGKVVKDFIPVRVGQVGYLYDRVSGTLFSNAGTGNFTLGPDVT